MTKNELVNMIKQILVEESTNEQSKLNEHIDSNSFKLFVDEVLEHNINLTNEQLIDIANSVYDYYSEKTFELADDIDLDDYFSGEFADFSEITFEKKIYNSLEILEDEELFKKDLKELNISFEEDEDGYSEDLYNLQVALQKLEFTIDFKSLNEYLTELYKDNKAYEEDERWFARGGHRGYI